MQPKLADCFVVPKKNDCIFLSILVFRKIFYHAVFIMRIDYDCMFEEIMLVVQVLLQLFLTNSIFFFCCCCSFPVLSCCHLPVAWNSVVMMLVFSLNSWHLCCSLCFLLTSCFCLYSLKHLFPPVLCVYVCEKDI